jgi:hypothetical protein
MIIVNDLGYDNCDRSQTIGAKMDVSVIGMKIITKCTESQTTIPNNFLQL